MFADRLTWPSVAFVVGLLMTLLVPTQAGARPESVLKLLESPAKDRGPAPSAGAARTTAGALTAGAAVRVITPFEYETWNDADGDATYEPPEDSFNDAGVDHAFDPQEPGAFGADLKPGKAGIDDNSNGVVDDTSEYLATGSDDRADPAGDNYNASTNPTGTEKNGAFESVALAGFQGFMGEDIRPMNGVHDELYARALVLSDGDTHVLLIVADLLGLLFPYTHPAKRDIEAATGIPFNNIIIAATHTHHGPDPVGLWAGMSYSAYMQWMQQQLVEAGKEAWARREPVQVRSTTAQPPGCYDPVTKVQMPNAACYLGDYESANMSGASLGYDTFMLQTDMRDPWVRRLEIPVLQLVGTTGKTVATVVSFDDHPEVLLDENPLASSDFPHYVRSALEESVGGISLYLSGTVGCQMGALRGTPIPLYDELGEPVFAPGQYDAEGNPLPEWAQGAENRTRSLGFAVAHYALEAILDAGYSQSSTLRINSSWVDISIDNPIYRMLINKIKKDPYFEDGQYLVRAPWCSSTGCARTQLHWLTLADATFLTAPGEFPPEYVVGREASVTPYSQTDPNVADYNFPALPGLRGAVKTRDLFFVGLANSYYGYAIPKADTLAFTDTDHPNYYEEGYNPTLCFGDAVGNRLFQMLGSSATFSDCVPRP